MGFFYYLIGRDEGAGEVGYLKCMVLSKGGLLKCPRKVVLLLPSFALP